MSCKTAMSCYSSSTFNSMRKSLFSILLGFSFFSTTAKLIAREGKDHGWPGMDADMRLFADWFDAHLRGIKETPASN